MERNFVLKALFLLRFVIRKPQDRYVISDISHSHSSRASRSEEGSPVHLIPIDQGSGDGRSRRSSLSWGCGQSCGTVSISSRRIQNIEPSKLIQQNEAKRLIKEALGPQDIPSQVEFCLYLCNELRTRIQIPSPKEALSDFQQNWCLGVIDVVWSIYRQCIERLNTWKCPKMLLYELLSLVRMLRSLKIPDSDEIPGEEMCAFYVKNLCEKRIIIYKAFRSYHYKEKRAAKGLVKDKLEEACSFMCQLNAGFTSILAEFKKQKFSYGTFCAYQIFVLDRYDAHLKDIKTQIESLKLRNEVVGSPDDSGEG